jgi:Cu-Zn family superoxide dismutase
MKFNFVSNAVLCGIAISFAGCASNSESSSGLFGHKLRPAAIAVLSPAQGQNVSGQVSFREETEGVRVVADIKGLTPGKHGFHIHEKGDCSAPDFSSAGGHFNPTGMKHGSPTDPEHHMGDFGNITANEQGEARFERVVNWLSFKGTNSFVGKAVIVLEKADDLQSQPSGNAGGRIACGVIQSVPSK